MLSSSPQAALPVVIQREKIRFEQLIKWLLEQQLKDLPSATGANLVIWTLASRAQTTRAAATEAGKP